MEIFAFFNRPKNQQKCRQYYPVTIPLQVSRNGRTVNSLDASWLEHMSDHFRKGGVLVNAVFHLGMANGKDCPTAPPSPVTLPFPSPSIRKAAWSMHTQCLISD